MTAMNPMNGAALELDHCKRMVARLTTLHHTVERLHAALRKDDVAHVVNDVVLKTIGGKDCAIYAFDPSRERLRLMNVTSGNVGAPNELPRQDSLIGGPAVSGHLFINNTGDLTDCAPWERTLRAAIPVKFLGRVTALIAIFGLDASKKHFTPLDVEMFDVLSRHVGVALNTAAANEQQNRN
jgi:GAF domain-containing protein